MKPLLIFYILLVYVMLQVAWWGYLLVELSPNKVSMIIGEFSVFILLLILGVSRLRKAIKEEESLLKQQKNFLLSVTHELKSPLASIKLYLQTILKRDLELEQRKHFLKNSLSDIERLDDLVENMLMATKFENKSYTFPKERFDLSETVGQVIKRIREHTQGVFYFREDVEQGIELSGDKFALASAVSNLIENAVKYSPEGSDISVKLSAENGQISFMVADQGVGIDDREKRKIFSKFYRSGNELTRDTKGTGLGLFIVKQVLDHHQAEIQVRNNSPKGSIFEILF